MQVGGRGLPELRGAACRRARVHREPLDHPRPADPRADDPVGLRRPGCVLSTMSEPRISRSAADVPRPARLRRPDHSRALACRVPAQVRRLGARLRLVAGQAAHVLHGALGRLREPLRHQHPELSAVPADRDHPLHVPRRRGQRDAAVDRVERAHASSRLVPAARDPARLLARRGDDVPRELRRWSRCSSSSAGRRPSSTGSCSCLCSWSSTRSCSGSP